MIANRASVGSESDGDFLAAARLAAAAAAARRLKAARFAAALRLAALEPAGAFVALFEGDGVEDWDLPGSRDDGADPLGGHVASERLPCHWIW